MRKLIILVLLLCGGLVSAQDFKENNIDDFTRIGIGFQGLELSYEMPLSGRFAMENTLGAGMGMQAWGDVQYTLDLVRPVTFVKSEIKYLYNINKRAHKNKRTEHNCANYWAAQVKYSFGNPRSYLLNKAMLAEVHWGLQRSLGGNFLFNYHMGIGYLQDFTTDEGLVSLTIGLKFSYIILK